MKTGSGDKILDFGVVVAAGILFFKTADILSYFSPDNLNDIVGADVSLIYGVVCALLVEGLALALHFNPRARLSGTATTAKWVLLAISGACQVFDGFVVTDTLAQQSDTLKVVLSYGVPLIPLLILLMMFSVGRLPELDGSQPERVPFVGVVPTVGKILFGEERPTNPTKAARVNASTPRQQADE
jgi:hypothetical protein